MEAVLIHKHHARLSPRLIPGSSPRSVLHCFLAEALFLIIKKQGCLLASVRAVTNFGRR
jgi:hypothetical protein